MKDKTQYQGFEQGPIRPPSEANSLLIRVIRNCPWNRCTFCPVYKDARFSKRPVEHIINDIDLIYGYINKLNDLPDKVPGQLHSELLSSIQDQSDFDVTAFNAALNWFYRGMQSIFLQDADSLMVSPKNLLLILNHLKQSFPEVSRITSYARSRTIIKFTDSELKAIHKAGLNRIHIGLESGHLGVLDQVQKGVTPEQHIDAGRKVIKAGIELSEYVMPGLGGQKYSMAHAIETANVINQINPHFIRLRTLAIPGHVELRQAVDNGSFVPCSENSVVEEIRIFINQLDGINSQLESDHILNLFEDLKGQLPHDKSKMLTILDEYLDLPDQEKMIYRIGRRTGMFGGIKDIQNSQLRIRAEHLITEYQVTLENIEEKISSLVGRYI